MTLQEKEQELINSGLKEPKLSETLSAWQKEQEQAVENSKKEEEKLNENIKISRSYANELGFNVGKGAGVFSLTRKEFQENPKVQKEATELNKYLKSDEFTKVDNETIYQQGLKNKFKTNELEDRNTKVDVYYTTRNGYKRNKGEKNKYDSNEAYESYLKQHYGDDYSDYKLYQAGLKDDIYTGDKITLNDKNLNEAKAEIYQDKLRAYLTNEQAEGFGQEHKYLFEAAKALNEENIQDPTKKWEATSLALEETQVNIEKRYKEFEKTRQPFIDDLDKIQGELQEMQSANSGVDFGGIKLESNWTEEETKLYNEKLAQYQGVYDEYEAMNFDETYDSLVGDTQLLRTSMENFNKEVESYGQDMMQNEVLNKMLGMDYSLGARASAALEDFFIGGSYNVAKNIQEGGLRLLKLLNNNDQNPEREARLEKSIELCQQTLTNYNNRIAATRAETLPPPLELDDIGKDGVSVFRYVGEALADNSPSILTTFIPAGAAIAGSLRVANAAGKGFGAMRAALKAQRTYGLYAMRASQVIFFGGESGGKLSELSIKQGEQKDRLNVLRTALNRTGDGAILNPEERDLLQAEADDIENSLTSNLSFATKSFAAYSYGGTATLAETLGSLKLVSGVNASAKAFGKTVAKKAMYEKSTNFAGVLAGGFIRGLRPAVTKAMPSELMEEALTQVSHNAIDVIVLGEDKPITEGLNADFFVKTAITSFAIMAPTTMSNTRQILQNEFTTRDEVAQNKKDVNELLVLQSQISEGKLKGKALTNAMNQRRAIVKKLGFSDAFKMQKLNHLSEAEIKEVAELGRQEKALGAQMRGLAGTGDTQGADAVNAKKKIQSQYDAIAKRKNELLGAKKRSTLQKQTDLNNKYGMSVNLNLEYDLGLYDFAQDAAMTMSDANKKYTVVSEAAFDSPELMRSELQEAGYTEAEVNDIVNKFTGDAPSNGIYTTNGDIVINDGAIQKRIHGATTASDAQYAAVAPLEELFHQAVAQKGLKIDGNLKSTSDSAIDELQNTIDDKIDIETNPEKKKQLEQLKDRIKKYEGGPGYYEETMAQINNAITLGILSESDLVNVPSLKSFINGAVSKILGDPSWMLQLETASDVSNFIKNHQRNVQDTKVLDGGTAEDDPLNAKPNIRDRESIGEIIPEATQAYMELDNSMLQQGLNEAIQNKTDQQFPLAQALVEKNWPLISKDLNINNAAEMNAAKEVVIDQILGQFEGSGQGRYGPRNTSALAGFDLEGGAQVSTYLAQTIKTRKPEIDAAIADRTAGPGIDVSTAGEVAVETTETTDTTQLARKPSETTGLDTETETRITEAVQKVYKGKDLKFSETRNIPKEVADIYGEEFGINPQTITDKTRNFQKTDADGLTKAKQFLLKNAKDDFARLPKTKDDFGKGTFIPKNVRDALYTDGELTGSLKDYMDLIRTKPEKAIYRDRVGQTIRGLLGLHIRNRMLETAQPSQAKRVQSGARFSKGEKIQPKKTRGKSIAQQNREKTILELNDISVLKNKQQVRERLGIKKLTINESTRQDIINEIEAADLPPAAVENMGLTTGGALRATVGKGRAKDKALEKWAKENNVKIKPGEIFYKTTDGNYIKGIKKVINTPEGKRTVYSQPAVDNLVPNRNKVFFGTNDPNYKRILAKAKKDYPNAKKPKQVKSKNSEGYFTEKNLEQSRLNQDVLYEISKQLERKVKSGEISIDVAAALIESGYQATNGLIKISAPFLYKSDIIEYGKDKKGKKYREEHNPPASVVGASLVVAIKNGAVDQVFPSIRENFTQTILSKKSDEALDVNYKDTLVEGTSILNPAGVRYAAADINLNGVKNQFTGKTMAQELKIPIKNKSDINLESTHYQNELIIKSKGEITSLDRSKLKASLPVQNLKAKQAVKNAGSFDVILNDNQRSQQQKDIMVASLESKGEAIKRDKPKKGISVFDFDDTLAKTKEKVIVNMPGGEVMEISASDFAKNAGDLQNQGAEFDFSNFENVSSDTQQGPLADLARKRQGKFGSGDIFVLTARPNSAGPAIKQFLENIGINIPLENITGLEDGSPQAKVDWVLNKTAEGYNDFYFADDSLANVEGVRQVLDAVDVKNKVQQALESKGERLNKDFNRQLEQVTGKEAFKKYSDARGRLEGQQKDKGTFKRFIKQFTITPSAEDFMGLMYAFMGKGAQGNAHAKFIKENLMDPYNKAEQELISAQVSVANDFSELKKQFPNLRSKRGKNPLLEEIGVGPYTKSQAIRVYMWNKQGMDIPGMSQRDVDALVKAVEADNELNVFADEVALIQKGEQYPAPTQNWLAGNIASDIMQGLKTGFRKKLMTEFNENADIIFSKENLNKIEAIYGSKFREALEDSLRRMRTGSNRPVFVGGGARIVNEMLDWLNASVGAVMFFNMRSGLLQLISNVNFINWGDNNIYDAAKAFVSKDYFPTVLKLLNSDYLINRRDGLKINVNEAELTDAGRKGGVKGMINYLLDKGFAITRIMDSVAIATGGATFFINRKKSLQNRVNKETGELYTEAEAEQQAFDDFYAIAEETQQSSNPSKISAQQASFAGRIILSFQNVTMQYNRKTKKSIQDLYNRRTKPGMTQRESDLSNLSSIIYYVGVQNLIFNAMQQALFGLAFDDEPDEEEKDKAANIVNGMADSLLFGLGFGGAIISTVKNVLMRIASESEKKTTQYRDAVWNVFDISPVLDSKVRKLRTAAKTFDWNMKEIKKRGWSIENPAYLAVAQIISATTNLPIDRALQKLNNLRQATDEETKTWQRVALVLGWSGWNFGLPYWGRQSTIDKEAKNEERLKEKFKIDVRKMKSLGFTKRVPFTGPKSGKPKGKLGVDYVAIERYDGLIQYYKKP